MGGFSMPVAIAYVLGAILALAGTIAAFIMIVPEKKRAQDPEGPPAGGEPA